jgi:alpha-mannosidase
MRVLSAESTELFVGPPDAPLQLARITYTGCGQPTPVRVDGHGLAGEAMAQAGDGVVEIPVAVDDPVVGRRRAARVHAAGLAVPFTFTVAEPGWTVFMISHFHYDPVWWNTQGAYTSVWQPDPPSRCRNGFELVRAHLEMARREPEYKFVLAEVDYLKPYWDTHPEDRSDLRRFIADGRVEVMGGTYNEPNTNLTSPETTIRNFVHGSGFQRDVLGAAPATAWQLDVFGHDPQFPGMAADAGLTSSSWARGPHHQWGPMHSDTGLAGMQFCSEFEWIAPSGRGLLTHYMPAHYSAGWWMDEAASLADAEQATYRMFEELKQVALTRNVLLPVGTDYTPPNKWVTAIHRDWAARYTWPRFVCALPREFFAAVRAELDAHGLAPSPQTRDMNPIYTGKDVSFIDTKQANRAAETAVVDAEKFAVFAGLVAGATYPQAALAKAWVQLAYGAHHDAITGSESDQVYLDLLTGWRDAWELGRAVRDNSLALLSRAITGDVVVWNSLAHKRTDVVTVGLDMRGRIFDADGHEMPAVVERDGRSVTFLASDVPSLGWRAYRVVPDEALSGWKPMSGNTIANEHYRLTVDPARGGGVSSWIHEGRELIAEGRVGNELALYEEYPAHPTGGEGPWHLLSKGPVV